MPLIGLPPPLHRSQRVGVVVLDVISDFRFPGGGTVLSSLQRRTVALRALLQRARTASIPVIYVNDNLGHWNSEFSALKAQAAKSSPRAARSIAALSPQAHDYVILKPRHSAFYGSPLEALLEHLRISTLVLTGVSTESCVWITACDAHTRGFALIAPGDTMAGLSPKAISATLTGLCEVLHARTPRHAASLRFTKGRLA